MTLERSLYRCFSTILSLGHIEEAPLIYILICIHTPVYDRIPVTAVHYYAASGAKKVGS